MARDIDWDAMREAFIRDAAKPQLNDFCMTWNIPYGTAKNYSSREKWLPLRDQHWSEVTRRAGPAILDLQATVQARDIGQKLTQIQAMKLNALKYAGGEGQDVAYEKPHEAVAAYERLEKLERLILGESTEHIQVTDARAYVREVLAIVREEVAAHDVLERIAQRVTGLSLGQRSDSGAAGLN